MEKITNMLDHLTKKVACQGEALETKTEEVAWLQEKVNLLEGQLEHQGRLIQEGLFKDSPYLMVCAHRDFWYEADSTVTYEYITLDVSNSDQPGGGDGTMDITTGVFTAITGGYYMITYGGRARVRIGHPMGQEAHMYIFRNGGELMQESIWQSEINLQDIHIETGVEYIDDQGSRTVVGHCLFYFRTF